MSHNISRSPACSGSPCKSFPFIEICSTVAFILSLVVLLLTHTLISAVQKVKQSYIQGVDEDQYAELLTPISPIKISFIMDKQTPEQHCESVIPISGTYEQPHVNTIQQFVALLQSDSDIVKFEAASSLLHALNIESATTGKF